jgi:hypothetical protein
VRQPQLSSLCEEALALCDVLQFSIVPSLGTLESCIQSQTSSKQLPAHLSAERLVDTVLKEGSCSEGDFHVGGNYRSEHMTIPSLLPRVKIASRYGKLKEAISICMEKNDATFWTNFRKGQDSRINKDDVTLLSGDLTQSCLHVIKAAILNNVKKVIGISSTANSWRQKVRNDHNQRYVTMA